MSDDVAPFRKTFVMGLDLGQSRDWTALCLNQLVDDPFGKPEHRILGLERWRGERYPEIVRLVRDRINAIRPPRREPLSYVDRFYPDNRPKVVLVVDYTGPGRPVMDMLLEAEFDAEVIAVTITGGIEVTRGDDGSYRVPKRGLASTLNVLQQSGRFKLARKLELAETLIQEADNFRAKISLTTGHDSYGAAMDWRDKDGHHDDLVLAAALACWAGENGIGTGRFEEASPEVKAALSALGL